MMSKVTSRCLYELYPLCFLCLSSPLSLQSPGRKMDRKLDQCHPKVTT